MMSDTAPEVGAPDMAEPAAADEERIPGRPAALPDAALDRVFREARTPLTWAEADIDEELLQTLYGLVKLGPTSGNCSPARFVFLRHRDNRERLRAALSSGNVERTLSAPVTVIVAHDPQFYEQLPRLYPQADVRSWFAADPVFAEETAFRNSTLQGGYLILAARMLGLDAAPMSGFDNAKVDEIFLDGQGWRSNFLVSLGYADRLQGGSPRAAPGVRRSMLAAVADRGRRQMGARTSKASRFIPGPRQRPGL